MNNDFENTKHAVSLLLNQIKQSPTAFHAVDVIKHALCDAGFLPLYEQSEWSMMRGGKYFVTRNDSSLLAFVIPKGDEPLHGYRVVAAHTDSPAFKLKDTFARPGAGYEKLNVERYGGMICSSWMDRPLSIAGRVLVETPTGIESKLVNIDRPCAIIPNVAIHMDRSANDGKSYNAQVDMLPVLGLENNACSFKNQLADVLGVEVDRILAHDLFLYTAQDGYIWGQNQEMISAPRLDDLACVFGGLQAFLQADYSSASHISVFAAFDNEEVGSQTLQGAASSFFGDVIDRIEYFLGNCGGDVTGKARRLSESLMLSADNAHAVHPNHPEYADAQNRPVIGGGIVLKFNAQQRYATDAIGAALFRKICALADVPVQTFANRSDMLGGSTLGNIASTRLPIRTIDIGLPQLAMHSAFETAGTYDYLQYISVCEAFYRAEITKEQDQGYLVKG